LAFGFAVAAFAWQPSSDATPRWAPASRATIHPGVQIFTSGAQCTANFVFYDNKDVYIGQAGHCASEGLPNETNGCQTKVLPAGVKVDVEGASHKGVLVYDSWDMMHRVHERDANTCEANDFALVRLHPADRGKVNPSIPYWGGPTGVARGVAPGKFLYLYGSSVLRAGIDALSPTVGLSMFDANGGWYHGFHTLTPGVFGDSGSPVLGPDGRALGVFVTTTLLSSDPKNTPLQSNASDLARALDYMKRHAPALRGVTLARGTESFSPIP
jgi:hypothetical protein